MLLKEKNDYFNWKLISSAMGLITKNTRLNDHKLFLRIVIIKYYKHKLKLYLQFCPNTCEQCECILHALICTLKSILLNDIAISF